MFTCNLLLSSGFYCLLPLPRRGKTFSVEASDNKIMGILNPCIGKFLRDIFYLFLSFFCTTVLPNQSLCTVCSAVISIILSIPPWGMCLLMAKTEKIISVIAALVAPTMTYTNSYCEGLNSWCLGVRHIFSFLSLWMSVSFSFKI